MIRWRPRLPLVGNLVCGQIERVNPKITPKPFSEGKPGPPACGLGAPPVGRPRTSMRIRLGASGSQRAMDASGSRRAIGASGSRRAIGASGSQRAIGASGSQRAIRASGSQRAISASGSQRAIGASGQWRAGGTKNHPRRNPKLGASSSLPPVGRDLSERIHRGRFVLKSNQKGGPANRRLYSCSSGSFFDENMLPLATLRPARHSSGMEAKRPSMAVDIG